MRRGGARIDVVSQRSTRTTAIANHANPRRGRNKGEPASQAAPPSATGPGGARFEGQVGAFYFLALIAAAEPRGLPGARVKAVRFQQGAHGRPLDDVTIEAANADGSDAFLDIQVKRTAGFTASDPAFADIVARLWRTAQKPEFNRADYQLAIAIARTSTRIEQHCQTVLHWARELTSGASFAAHIARSGFASAPMRDFVRTFRDLLSAAGAPVDDELTWSLLRRLQILIFDFESPGSDYEHRARELAASALAPDHRARAADFWRVLTDEALARDAAGGEADRADLIEVLSREHGFGFVDRSDLRLPILRLNEAAADALAGIREHVAGVRLSREALVDDALDKLQGVRVLEISGASGAGKSAVLKQLAQRLQAEGPVIVLAPGRLIAGGWLKMAAALECPVRRSELFNELGCSGGATLFIDNIDQIEDVADIATLQDMLLGTCESPGWRTVFTVRSEGAEWRANLPDAVRALGQESLFVGELNDAEAHDLSEANPVLSGLLTSGHPASAVARNLFRLSRLAEMAGDIAGIATECDLARQWWRFGGGRVEAGRLDRIRVLRELSGRLLAAPNVSSFSVDGLDTTTLEDLIAIGALHESRQGTRVEFRHDTFRDWSIAFLLEDEPARLDVMQYARPLPATLTRGLEIYARLLLEAGDGPNAWRTLLARLEGPQCHGSWRRPVLLAPPRCEDALGQLERLKDVLAADRARLLRETIRLMIAVESQPLAQMMARAAAPAATPADDTLSSMMIPVGPTWMPMVIWTLTRGDELPSAAIPEIAQLFHLWLMTAQNEASVAPMNARIVQRLHDWLGRIAEAERPMRVKDIRDAPKFDLDFERFGDVHEQIRMTFLAFCHLAPALAARFLIAARSDRYREKQELLRYSGAAARAAPAELVDFVLGELIPSEQDSRRRRRDDFGVFGTHDMHFHPASPGQGPFFDLLQHAPEHGLRLVRAIVKHATDWRLSEYQAAAKPVPKLAIAFPDGEKIFEGPYDIYQLPRGATSALVAACALMALEAWAHRQIEGGRPFKEVMHEVLGPSGSSAAFVCVAVDLVLSHWAKAYADAWPLLACPELLHFDQSRSSHDISGVGQYFLPGDGAYAKVKIAELHERPSRRLDLLNQVGRIAVFGTPELASQLRSALEDARARIEAGPRSEREDPITGLRALAARACQMADAANWPVQRVVGQDGGEIEARVFQIPAEEQAQREATQSKATASLVDTTTRLQVQHALEDPSKSTPELVAMGIDWATRQIETSVGDAVSSGRDARHHVVDDDDHDDADDSGGDDFDAQWRARTIVMSAALAARDYEGEDRSVVEAWARPLLETAARIRVTDLGARTTWQVTANQSAIAALGLIALYLRSSDIEARNDLLVLATRQDTAVQKAICGSLAKLGKVDSRTPIAIARLIMTAAVHPRRDYDDEGAHAQNLANYQNKLAAAIAAERAWLDQGVAEPAWPGLTLWPSRPKRGIRLGPHRFEDEERDRPRLAPDTYVDEHALASMANGLVLFSAGEIPPWLIELADRLLNWTVTANNGEDEEHDDRDRDNRPYHWNDPFFDFLGVLCAAIPFDQARTRFIEPMAKLHDQAFHDAVAEFLRGFDRCTLAIDTPKPENAPAVRALVAERLQSGAMARRMMREVSFTTETHLADALNAFLYQPSNWGNARPHIPDRWSGLVEAMPVLAPFVIAASNSGYLACTFMKLVETYPCPALAPFVLDVASEWCRTHGADPNYWDRYDLGARLCAWFGVAFADVSEDENVLPALRDQLGLCLDVLVRSGVAQAALVEARLVAA